MWFSTELPTNSFRARPKLSALSSNPTIFLTGQVKKVGNAQEVTEHADLAGGGACALTQWSEPIELGFMEEAGPMDTPG